MRRTFAHLMVELDATGGPESAIFFLEDDEGVTLTTARERFAPFDSLLDVGRWFTRAVRGVVPLHPR